MNIFLDSGAFSVWKKGYTISLQEYINFIQAHKDEFTVYANLDDMRNPEKTWENQREMERQGLNPLPVYHIGEPIKYFHKALEYPYFAVGGVVLKGKTNLMDHFENLFTVLCPDSNNNYPTHKVHGFALTSPKFVVNFPWFSADSTSWVMYGKYGIILMPRNMKAKGDYHRTPLTIFVSTRSKAQYEFDAHIDSVSLMHRKVIITYIEMKGFSLGCSEFKKVGDDYELKENETWSVRTRGEKEVEIIKERGLCNDHKLRDQFNLLYYLELERSIPKWPWPWTSKHNHLF